MSAPTLPSSLITQLTDAVGPDAIVLEAAERWTYGYDNSRRHGQPLAVVRPQTHQQVEAIVAACRAHHVPIVGRGRGTGTAGGAVPPESGAVVLSLERMNRILELDPDNRLLVAQPGVTNAEIQQAAAGAGFFWPPDPTSAKVCTLGGNLACNSAGPKAVKYGTPRDNTLGLRAVAGDGRGFRTGTRTTKGVVGYDLTRLLIGSEGTLGIITEATLKLTPLPSAVRTLRAFYRDMGSAARAVARIMAQPVTPCALEFIDGAAIEMVRRHSAVPLPTDAGALLMIEVDGSEHSVDADARAVQAAADGEGALSVTVATSAEEVRQLWATRKALSPALRNVAPKKINEDVVVPVSHMPELIEGLRELSERHGVAIVNFGHAGNGNIHVNLLVDPDDPRQMAAAEACLDGVFQLVLALGGTLSGEHGIGLVKREFVGLELDPVALELMQGLKRQFDPDGILNPGKKIPGI